MRLLVDRTDLHSKIRPGQQRDHFDIAVIGPCFLDLSFVKLQPDRFILWTGSVDPEETLIGGAGPLLALVIDKQPSKEPSAGADLRDFRLPPIRFAFHPVPSADPASAAQDRL